MEEAIYLHKNGSLIKKRGIVYENDPSYFSSPMVMKVWHRTNEYKKNDWMMMLTDAIVKGALPLEIKRVALENNLSDAEVKRIFKTRR